MVMIYEDDFDDDELYLRELNFRLIRYVFLHMQFLCDNFSDDVISLNLHSKCVKAQDYRSEANYSYLCHVSPHIGTVLVYFLILHSFKINQCRIPLSGCYCAVMS